MKKLLSLTALLIMLFASHLSVAGDAHPLFVNMTTNDPFHSVTGIGFAARQQAQGHPITVFLNDKGVLLASKAHKKQYSDQQKVLDYIMRRGGSVIVCPSCIRHYEIKEADLLPGIKVGNAEVTGAALFADNTRTLTW